jgi:probable rRNA maturation factor
MPKIKVSVSNKQTEIKKIPVGIKLLIRRCCQAVLTMEHFQHDAEISVSFVSNEEIKKLNSIYRQKDSVTDVLSFPLTDGKNFEPVGNSNIVMLGDIVISLETAIKQAAIFGHSLEREIGFLTVHSTLHLLGYDHELSSLDERIMREKEEHVLDELGISRDATFFSEGGDL